MTFTFTTLGAWAAGLAVLVWIAKYWTDTTSKDLGTMSEKWVAENNNSHL
jgi:hypothetical protein